MKIKRVFWLLFLVVVVIWGVCVGFVISESVKNLRFKQYEQQLNSLDDGLKFGLLRELDSKSIKEFGHETGADFIIRGDGKGLDTMKNAAEFLNFAQQNADYVNFVQKSIANGLNSGLSTREGSSKLIKAKFGGRDILYKAYELGAYRYIIIVYPQISGLESYFKRVSVACAICAVLCFVLVWIFRAKFNARLTQILNFLDKTSDKSSVKLTNSRFEEINLLNSRLKALKSELLKRQKSNSKNNDKS